MTPSSLADSAISLRGIPAQRNPGQPFAQPLVADCPSFAVGRVWRGVHAAVFMSVFGWRLGDPGVLPYSETCPMAWIAAGTLHIDFSFVLDQLSLVMLLVVTGVGFLIHVYSVGYMGHEEGYARCFTTSTYSCSS